MDEIETRLRDWAEWPEVKAGSAQDLRNAADRIAALSADLARVTAERDAIAEMARGGAGSLANLLRGTFAGRGVTISDDESARAAKLASEVILHAALAGNPRDWCLSCGTVSGDGQCHCTEPFAAGGCNRKARNYTQELIDELQATEARALAAEAALAKAVEAERESFKAGLEAAAQFLEACDDYGDRHKATEIRALAKG